MMPNVSTAIRRFEVTLQFQIVQKTVVDGDLAEASRVVPVLWFEGLLEPLNAQELMIKAEGERKFKWWSLFTDLEIEVDTVIKDQDGKIYRVMNSTDWMDSGYHQYQLKEGPGVSA